MPKTNSQYWMRDLSGQYGVTLSPEAWKPRGWAVVTKAPKKTDLVWMTHEASGGKQAFAYGAAEQWVALGWALSEPPTPADLTKDPDLVDVEETSDEEAVPDDIPVLLESTEPAPKKATGRKNQES